MRQLAISAFLLAAPLTATAADNSSQPFNDPDAALRGSYVPQPADIPTATSAPFASAGLGGVHFGVDAGYGGDKEVYTLSALNPASKLGSASLATSGFSGGGHFGYDYAATGGAVIGAEVDFSGSTMGSNASIVINGNTVASGGSRINYFGTVRGRVGYLFGSAMVYGTGGFAYGGVTSNVSLAGYGSGSVSTWHEGYVVGGGIQYALAPNIFLRTEYLRLVLDSRPIVAGSLGGTSYQLSEAPSANIVRAGIDFRFGSWTGSDLAGSIAARY